MRQCGHHLNSSTRLLSHDGSRMNWAFQTYASDKTLMFLTFPKLIHTRVDLDCVLRNMRFILVVTSILQKNSHAGISDLNMMSVLQINDRLSKPSGIQRTIFVFMWIKCWYFYNCCDTNITTKVLQSWLNKDVYLYKRNIIKNNVLLSNSKVGGVQACCSA